VRVTPSEFAQIAQRAEAEQRSLSSFARLAVVGVACTGQQA
jgi:hypothetical protein